MTADLVPYKTRGRFYKPQWRSSLMWISKTYLRIAAVSLLSLASTAQVWAQENVGEIDSFNRNLGLEGMGTDLANVEHELEHGNPANPAETSNQQGAKKAPVQKKAPIQRTASFSNLAFQNSPVITNNVRDYYVSHLNAQTMVGMPSYDTLISRFDQRFANYGFSRHNLGDTFAGYLIISWEIIHDADASSSPRGIRRVREAVCQILEQRGKAAKLSDETKQKYSELCKSISELVSEQSKRNREGNNQAAEKLLKNQISQAPLKLGIDLRRLRLTDQGFVNG